MTAIINEAAFDAALASHGLRAPGAATARAAARAAFSQLVVKVARRLLESLSIVSSKRTLQPEHFHDLAKIAGLLSATIAAPPPSGRPGRDRGMLLMRGGSGMPLSYFSPADAAGGASYTVANESSHSPTFPDAGPGVDGTIRYGLDASNMMTGGAAAALPFRRTPGSWLTDDALATVLRECKSRSSNSNMRVSESARGLLRVVIESNAGAVLTAVRRAAKGGSGKPSATAAAISKETGRWVLQL
jgi:hypothetical protein